MWNAKRMVLAAACASALVACDDGTGPSAEELAGTWNATKAELVSVANPSIRLDVVALGGTVQLVLNENKTFTLTSTLPGEPAEVASGTWSSSVDQLTLTFTSGLSGDMQFDMALSGDTLTLGGADDDFDFNDDGVEEPAKVYLTLARQ